jgi:hypothetical protein
MNLISAAQASGGSQTISFPYFVAFISLLSNIELIKKIYLNATNGSRTTEVTKGKVEGVFTRLITVERLGFCLTGMCMLGQESVAPIHVQT